MMKHLLALLALLAPAALHAEAVRDRHVAAELIAENTSFQPGQPFAVAVRLVMDPHWHTYWRNAGDSGLGTTVDWDLPEGFQAGAIEWPHPSRIPSGPLVSYGYEGEVLLLTTITPPATWSGTAADLKARVAWLMCEEVCIPGDATVSLTLPLSADHPQPDPATTGAWAAARNALPRDLAGWSVTGRLTPDGVELTVTPGPDGRLDGSEPYFYPYADNLLDHAAAQAVTLQDGRLTLTAPRAAGSPAPERLAGVLVRAGGWQADGSAPALLVDIPLGAPPAAATAPVQPPMRLGAALLFAFLGGMILNLMPCVFPVLSIKVLGFVEQAGAGRGKLLAHGLVFTAGVLACFWALAGTLMILRAGGAGIGWGFQLQSPAAVSALAALFFLLGLSLFGVFEFGLSLTGAGSDLQRKQGWAGSFFSGLLAVIVATPCTAPFMGAALGWALTQPPLAAMAIFTSLGLGMASPYLLFSASPALVNRMPRPGPWMESMKQFMGFLMLATVLWLLWVLGQQAGTDGLVRMLAVLLVLGFAAWIAGRWGALHRPPAVRRVARGLALLLVAGGVYHAVTGVATAEADSGTSVTAGGQAWEPYSPERVAQLRAEGRPVFIDFTASWCLTCQVNKRVALHQDAVEKAFREKGVVTLKADWTGRDEGITRALAAFGRSGVPLYVLYGRGPDTEAKLLPEVLTPGLMLEALQDL